MGYGTRPTRLPMNPMSYNPQAASEFKPHVPMSPNVPTATVPSSPVAMSVNAAPAPVDMPQQVSTPYRVVPPEEWQSLPSAAPSTPSDDWPLKWLNVSFRLLLATCLYGFLIATLVLLGCKWLFWLADFLSL